MARSTVTPLVTKGRAASRSGQLAASVARLIREEKLDPGDRLPSVRALAERFTVAPPTIREALRQLEATGVVEFRHGAGLFVGGQSDRLVIPHPHRQPMQRATLLELLRTRELIEPALAEQAAATADPGLLRSAEAALLAAAGSLHQDDAGLSAANLDLHRGIAAAAGNSVLTQVLDSLLTVYEAEQRHIMALYADRRGDYQAHAQVLAAVRSGRPKAARRLMAEHLRQVREAVTAALATSASATNYQDTGKDPR